MCTRCDSLRARRAAFIKRRQDRLNAEQGFSPTHPLEPCCTGTASGNDCTCGVPAAEPATPPSVDYNANERELDELLAVANTGRNAMIELHKRFGDRVAYASGKLLNEFNSAGASQQLRKVVKPFFPELSFSLLDLRGQFREMVKVTVEGAMLVIGCRKFEYQRVGYRLHKMLKQNLDETSSPSAYQQGAEKLRATRHGIRYGSHVLAWDDAEKLYNAIQEMQKARLGAHD